MIHLANPVVCPVRYEKIIPAVQRNSRGIANVRAGSGQSVAGKCAEASSCNRGDPLSSLVNLTNSVILTIRDKDVSGAIDCNRGGGEETRAEGRAAIAAKSKNPIACDGGHGSAGINFTDDVIQAIRNVYIPGGVHGDAVRSERAFNRRLALRYSSRNRGNNSWKFLGCCRQTGQQHQGKDAYKGLLEKTSAS